LRGAPGSGDDRGEGGTLLESSEPFMQVCFVVVLTGFGIYEERLRTTLKSWKALQGTAFMTPDVAGSLAVLHTLVPQQALVFILCRT
jgi:hypothetical protein